MAKIAFSVNGQLLEVEASPDTPLLYVLRNDLGLKGAKFGCGVEQCGACQVIVGGEAVPSCRLQVGSVAGEEITTIEGLGTAEQLHPIQAAFVAEQAAQCGYCTPGMIVAAKALLDRNPAPTDREVRDALAIHLCRCGAYPRILRAVQRAASELAP
jgi:nicotinate dehydrogenase subunit A